jgi:hypothetical protein
LIDKVATLSHGKLSDYGMIVIKDKGMPGDKISFSLETFQINFATTSQSRPVTKVRANRHNCGTQAQCEAIAVQFENAINEWKNRRAQ